MVSLLQLFDEGKLDAYHAELKAQLTPEQNAYNAGFSAGWFGAKEAYPPASTT